MDSDAYGSLCMIQSDPSSQTALSEKTQLRCHELVKLLTDQSLYTWLLTVKPDLSINELHTDRRQAYANRAGAEWMSRSPIMKQSQLGMQSRPASRGVAKTVRLASVTREDSTKYDT